MASSKRKLDEKHLKILRELVSLTHNKHCFDCNQRGPTYINMTIGSYICTQCSGLLRGLNPPHRVKSISMMSFTTDEIDYLKARGNDLCRKVWLGLCNDKTSIGDSKEIEKLKSDMSIRYEKRRYYVEPSHEMFEYAKSQNSVDCERKTTSDSSTKSRPLSYTQKSSTTNSSKLPPPIQIPSSLSTTTTTTTTTSAKNNTKIAAATTAKQTTGSLFDSPVHAKTSVVEDKNVDLLSDLGHDLFKSSTSSVIHQQSSNQPPTLFQTNPQPKSNAADLFSMTSQSGVMTSTNLNPSSTTTSDNKPQANLATLQSNDDKYAALMNLTSDPVSDKQTPWSSTFNSSSALSSSQGVFGNPAVPNIASNNPVSNGAGHIAGNPFITPSSALTNDHAFSSMSNSNSFPSSSSSSNNQTNSNLFHQSSQSQQFANSSNFANSQNDSFFNSQPNFSFPNSSLPQQHQQQQQQQFSNGMTHNPFPNNNSQNLSFPANIGQQNDAIPGTSVANSFGNLQTNSQFNSNIQSNAFTTPQNSFQSSSSTSQPFTNSFNANFPNTQMPNASNFNTNIPSSINKQPSFEADFTSNLPTSNKQMFPTSSSSSSGFNSAPPQPPPPSYQQSFPVQNNSSSSFATNFTNPADSSNTLHSLNQNNIGAFSQISLDNNPNPFMNVAKQNNSDATSKINPLNPFL